ncbi:MAG: DUF6660 family protein [Bacteroidota bacterium]
MKNAGKIFAAVLAAYMLSLFLLPCTGNCNSDEHGSSIAFQATQDHHEHENDNCSPFCLCDCCSTIITVVHSTQLNAFIPSVEKKFCILTQSFFSEYSDDCWQPPRTL